MNGPGVFEHHCSITRNEDDVIIIPCPNARILIDGVKITNDFYLQQGSMLTIGDSNLRFNHPLKAELMKKTAMNSFNQITEENEETFQKKYKTNSINFTENNVPKNLNNSVDNISRKIQNLKLKTNESYPRVGSLPLKIYPILGTADQNAPKLSTPADEMKELDEVLQNKRCSRAGRSRSRPARSPRRGRSSSTCRRARPEPQSVSRFSRRHSSLPPRAP